ncbi:MAG: hypothetical protein NTY45_07710 [Elusimicrobia bacterium]|nr:hypothetical protein [Elusimicrobiota bacterium]
MKSVPRTAQTAEGVRTSNFRENFFTQDRTRPKYSPSETESLFSVTILKEETGASFIFEPSSVTISAVEALAVRSSSPVARGTSLAVSLAQEVSPLFLSSTSPRHCATWAASADRQMKRNASETRSCFIQRSLNRSSARKKRSQIWSKTRQVKL